MRRFLISLKDRSKSVTCCQLSVASGLRGPRRRSVAGFTVIEAVMVMALITLGMSAVFYLTAIGSSMNMDTKNTMAAYQAANEYMEYIRQAPYSSSLLNVSTNAVFGASSGQVGYDALSKLPNAQGTYTIANGGDANIKQVTVQVKWSHHSASRNVGVSLVTYIASQGLNERWK